MNNCGNCGLWGRLELSPTKADDGKCMVPDEVVEKIHNLSFDI